ncbi:MAG: LCP family protein [Chloroflexota bacterium]
MRILAALLALLLLAPAAQASALTPQLVRPEDGLRVAMRAMHQLATDRRDARRARKIARPRPGLPIKLGQDGRLTVLILGSDFRAESGGERLDVVMVATIDPLTGKAALLSIPRDLSGIPLAGGSNSGAMRVNSIYYIRYRDPALPHGRLDRKGLKRFSRDIGVFLGTEIDYWALTRFDTFSGLINTLGGVRVDIEQAVLDPTFHHRDSRGIWFPRKDGYRLRGNPACKPKPRKCRSALVYVRSRKGTMGDHLNNDFRRAERQQDVVRAGVRQVLDGTGSGVALLGLLLGVRQKVETNMPTTSEAAAQLFALVSKMKLPRTNMKVLAPATWAYTAADRSLKPNLSTIRRWVDKNFYKVRTPPRQAD